MAVFPKVPLLPIGRTAGSLLGAALMVVFQVIRPSQAFAAVDLPILGLLFGTMVVSVYLERADLFQYLGSVLSWKSRGGKDLLCRVSLLAGISSALFTNDTTCVIFTEFVLRICGQKNFPPQPFLMALATSANIGSATTPIGNPQNLVIAVQSQISFGKFLLGIFPAVAVGIVVNTLGLLLIYWRRLSKSTDMEESKDEVYDVEKDRSKMSSSPAILPVEEHELPSVFDNTDRLSNFGPADILNGCGNSHDKEGLDVNSHDSEQNDSPPKCPDSAKALKFASAVEDNTNKFERIYHRRGKSDGDIVDKTFGPGRCSLLEINDLLHLEPRNSFSRQSQLGSRVSDIRLNIASLSRSSSIILQPETKESQGSQNKMRRRLWKISVYVVTVGMLVALLYGLNLSWSAMTAAVVLMVLDFDDASPSLDQVSYSLLVFFSGMFITVEGFNKTGIPGELWNAVEPHSRINTASGVALLSIVVILLSNVASNVPTVLLLGMRVAMSAEATPGASVTKAWLILAWVSTVAGNLTLVGSAANLIVSEQARRAKNFSYNLSFWNHLRFGFPATLLVIAIGLPLIHG
ncbi:hypothetical protein O6H91_09G070300 [Diphasiastrum complanatum]|nr:hypothetical protein O6H91_09G070300 [Diphasiastrum complanatum]KAJ7544231.1 hypothetical protein O6H91_09G070300 [Diphasiastrum complanatum]